MYRSESVLSFDDLEDDEKDNVKRKTRNLSEKKRRDQFNVLINELCSMVAANCKKMDKSSVLKSAIQFLRNHQEFSVQSAAYEIKEDWKPTFLCNEEFAQLMLEAVDSFLVVFTQQGKVVFTSDSVTSLLGHLPSDLINNSLYDLMHEDDRIKLFNLLSKQQSEDTIAFTCHLRRGTIDPTESVTYEYVKVCGTSQYIGDVEDESMLCDDYIGIDMPEQALCFCCTVRLQTSHIIREMSGVDEATSEFTSRHSLEWKFLFLDHRAPPIIGYLPFEVLGTSGYDYYHPDDLEVVSTCHEQLMLLGKGTSKFYRFLTKGQQWIWLQTRYFITYHQWSSKPEFIVCTNTVVGYSSVRKQLRQDMGYVEVDQASNVNTHASNVNNQTSNANTESTATVQETQQEAHVTSVSQSDKVASIVQSPDVASSQHSDSECPQQPHSTKRESCTRVNSQLQSLLQLHLQRSGQASISTTAALTHSQGTTLASSSAQTKVSSSCKSTVPSPVQQVSVGHAMASVVPVMAAISTSLVTMTPSHRLQSSAPSSCQTSAVVSSPLTSVSRSDQSYQTGLILTPAQQLLHEQLVHKSEQLQSAIQRQQEELRLIKEQLAYAQNTSQMTTHRQQTHHHQQQQLQPQQQQYILQQQLGLSQQPMLLAPTSTSSQLAMMGTSANHIFLSPVRGMDTHHQQVQQFQQQQLLLQQDAGQSVLLSSPQLMASSNNHIFLSPINMDLLGTQQQTPALHFLGVACTTAETSSNNLDLSDSC
ncbi:circadian locomoter output cycles protein kaput-like isoform X2 [Physella acuta]|uniref:circadian locomoter output cycles protein kaput-like isoform X2 n=1 Tax=Physella acuta TaxID=109671 RepID=UPI0027DC953C|nr:circadian locomoter output cycles protein kaput-like isoform X2 [Physella acuta]